MTLDPRALLMLWGLERPVAAVLVETSTRAMLVVVVALIAGRLLRSRSAALRRYLWIGSLMIVLVVGLAGIISALGAAVSRPFEWVARGATPETTWGAAATHWAVWIWLLPTVVLLLRLGIMQLRLRGVLAGCTPVTSASWSGEARSIGARIGLRKPVVLLASRRLESPVTVGALRPRVVIPESFLDADRTLRESVLWHEIAHVRRRDVAGRWLAAITCATQWFNPLVWLAARQLRRECECASDDAVLGGGIPGSTYARHLLALASTPAPQPAALVSFSIGASELCRRIESIAGKRERGELGRLMRVALTTACVAMLLLVLQLRFPQPQVRFISAPQHGTMVFLDADTGHRPASHRQRRVSGKDARRVDSAR